MHFGTIGKHYNKSIYQPLFNKGIKVTPKWLNNHRVSYEMPTLVQKLMLINTDNILLFNVNYINYGIIYVTQYQSIPYSLEIKLYERRSGELIKLKRSESNGTVTFNYLNPELTYFAVAHDPFSALNADICDLSIPKLME